MVLPSANFCHGAKSIACCLCTNLLSNEGTGMCFRLQARSIRANTRANKAAVANTSAVISGRYGLESGRAI